MFSAVFAYNINDSEDLIALIFFMIFILILTASSVRYSLAYKGKIKINWTVKPDTAKKLNIVWRGTAQMFLFFALIIAVYVKYKSDIIFLCMLLITIICLVIFFRINFKYYDRIE